MLLGTPSLCIGEPGLKSWLHTQFQLSANAHPGKLQAVPQVFGSLSPSWDSWMELPLLGLALPSPCCCRHMENEPLDVRFLFDYLSLSLSHAFK